MSVTFPLSSGKPPDPFLSIILQSELATEQGLSKHAKISKLCLSNKYFMK